MWIYTLLPQILNMSLTASIIIVLVLLARLPLKRAPKIFSYALWAVVLFRLVCPVSFSSHFSLIGLLPASAASATGTTYSSIDYIPADIVHTEFPHVDLPIPGVSEAINDSLPQGMEQLVADPLEAPMAIATQFWILGIAGMLIYSAVSLIRLRRKLVGAVRLRDNIFLADHIASPFVIGILRPKIYLPSMLPSTLPEAEQSYVILHEQTHIKRFDHIMKMLAFLTLALHWFNPLVWVAFICCVKDMEMSCDERVLKQMGGEIKGAYGTTLLSLATGRRLINGSPLAFGEGGIKGRIKNVLNYKKPAFWMMIIAVIACIFAAICLLSNPKAEADASYDNPNVEQLLEYRTAYVGNNSAVSHIVGLLNFPSDVAYDHIELQTASVPYGAAVYFIVTPEVRAAYDTSEPENIDVFRVNACIMLSLIENADQISFYLDDGTENAIELQFSREWAESIVGADLWKESSAAEKLDSLMTQIKAHVESAYAVAEEISTGPFVGYVKDATTDTFDVYTDKGGSYIMSLPWSSFEQFPASDRTYPGWQPGWMDIDIYCGAINDFTWAVICTGPSLGTGNANVCTSSDGGKTWWVGDRNAMYTGTVTGAGFASSEIGFMSYRYFFDQGPEISRTLDGGKTWDRMTVAIPSSLEDCKMTPLVPTFTGASGIYPIEFHHSDSSDMSIAYLVTKDGGMTWDWQETSSLGQTSGPADAAPVIFASEKAQAVMDAVVSGETVAMNLTTQDGVGGGRYEVPTDYGNGPNRVIGFENSFNWSYAESASDVPPASVPSLKLESPDGTAVIQCWQDSKLVLCTLDSETIWLSAGVLDNGATIFTYLRFWYDEAEIGSLRSDIVIPDNGQSYQEIAQAWADAYEGAMLRATPGSKFACTYVKTIATTAEDAMDSWYPESIMDTEHFYFSYSTVFVPENDLAKAWLYAGNTSDYEGNDAPTGAMVYSRMGPMYLSEEGWRCDGAGTGP